MRTVPQTISDVTKDSPGQRLFLEKVGYDEPIFILRGRDKLAIPTILAWIGLAGVAGVSTEKVKAAVAHGDLFSEYAREYGVRLPD